MHNAGSRSWRRKALMLAISAFPLTACGGSTLLGAVRVPPPDSELTAPCDGLQALGSGALTVARTETLWSRDRGALAVCSARHAALTAYTLDLIATINPETSR